jgi:uncharacterized membrane protein
MGSSNVEFRKHCKNPHSVWLTCLLVLFCCFTDKAAAADSGDFNHTLAGGEITITGYTGPGGAVTIPSTIDGLPVTRIGDSAFYCLTAVTSVEIPSGVVSIGNSAFAACSGLTTVAIPSTVTDIGEQAFNSTALVNVNIPSGVIKLGHGVFSGCQALTDITIPASVTSMGTGLFQNCRGLTSATILASVTNIGNNAFNGCSSLTSAILPSNLTGLADYLFFGCSKLTSVPIPSGVTTIGIGVFDGCILLPAITIPAGVTSIASYAFRNCRSLENLTLLGGVQTIGYYAFGGCLKLAAVNFPAGLTDIGGYAFSGCQALASVTLPAGVTRIDNFAFFSCPSLADVTIPASVTTVGFAAFAHCSQISNLIVDETNPNYRSVDGVLYDKAMSRLMQYPGARAGSYIIPDGVTNIDIEAFCSSKKLTGIIIPSSVAVIGESSFASCPMLENVTIPSSVTGIAPNAFLNCGKLSGVLFLGNTPSMGLSVFDSAAAGFTIFYQQGAMGFTSPLWRGYPAMALSAGQEIVLKGPVGETMVDGITAVDFGYLLPGTSSSKSFTVFNAGSATLTGLSINVDGISTENFTISALASPVLAPGMSTTFIVTFTPETGGAKNAALHVLSDDADESPFDIPISGICTPTPVPEITVTGPPLGTFFEDGVTVLHSMPTEVGTFVVTGVTITNSGTGDMQGISITLDGENAADFSFTSTPPAILAPGASFSCIVNFSPIALGNRIAQLHITSDDPDENPFDINLSGNAVPKPAPEIAVDPSSGPELADGVSIIAFDSVSQGSQSAAQTFTIRNQGNAHLQNLAITKTGPNPLDFIISSLSKTSLSAGQSVTFTVKFSPLTIGNKSATLHIASNDADESPFDIQLSGTSSAAPSLPEITVRLSDGTVFTDGDSGLSFDSVELDDSITRDFSIFNNGTAALTNLDLTIDGDHAADFSTSGPSSTIILPGGSATFSVNFTPSALGARTARLHIASNDSDETPFDIDLDGNGIPSTFPEIVVKSSTGTELVDNGAAVSIGSVKSPSNIPLSFTIWNVGDQDLMNLSATLDGPSSAFFLMDPLKKTDLAPGESTTISMVFQAKNPGNVSAMLHLMSNDSDESSFDIPLSGTVLAPPEIDVQQPTGKSLRDGSSICSFGLVKVKSSYSKVFTIKNLGKGNLDLTSVTKNGRDAKDFIISAPAITVLKPGATVKFKVTFKPSAAGLRKAAIQIKSSDSNEGTFDIDLTGKGAARKGGARVSPRSGSIGSASPISATLISSPVVSTIHRESNNGLSYLTLTVIKTSEASIKHPLVEVSSNLVDWYSGSYHTTVIHDDMHKLVVRDNTPIRAGRKRYVRIKFHRAGSTRRKILGSP